MYAKAHHLLSVILRYFFMPVVNFVLVFLYVLFV